MTTISDVGLGRGVTEKCSAGIVLVALATAWKKFGVAGELALVVAVLVSTNVQAQSDRFAGVRAACSEDYRRHCSGVQAGGGRILKCLNDNGEKLDVKCRTALNALPAKRRD